MAFCEVHLWDLKKTSLNVVQFDLHRSKSSAGSQNNLAR